jgi:oxygen-dependent protoporphyrinogen oxidase
LSSPITSLHKIDAFSLGTPAGAVQARAVIVAAPAYAAAGIFRAGYPALAGLCDAMPYASTATVAFGYRRDGIDHPLLGSGFVVPRAEGNALLAATWVTSKWPQRAPDGHVLLRAFLGGGRDPHRLDASDGELIQTARHALASVMPIRGEPLFARLYRWTRGSPQFEVGHTRRLAEIETCLDEVPGLYVTGSGFRSIGIPDCIADARATAGRVAAYVTDTR